MRLLDLSAALSARFGFLEPTGDAGDLDVAIQLTDQVLASTAEPAIMIRAHKLRGPALVTRDEIRPGTGDLARTTASFQALVDLTDPADPQHADLQHRLAGARRLLAETHQPPNPPAAR